MALNKLDYYYYYYYLNFEQYLNSINNPS